ncbi:MAG: sulfatase-like hydrolase/transferase [Bacteroidetes bacterium]|nr:sulfatase-like hydrolase/transferase [Bacteroidota bacterium]
MILLVLYTISRILFYLFNNAYFQDASTIQLLKIFLFGIRFDYAAIIQFNLLFIILYLLPFPFADNKRYQSVLFISFWIINALLLLTNFIDIEYFKYTSKRTTADIFKYALISDDVRVLIPKFLKDFWYVPLLWILTLAAGIWLSQYKRSTPYKLRFKIINLILMLLLTGILFITSRGFGMKPLRIISAARYASSQDIPLLINTPFSILHTIQQNKLEPRNYFIDGEYQKVFNPLRQYPAFQKRTDNVVILILESFSHEFIGTLSGKKTYTPFLDSLLNQSLAFENGFANCRKSIEAIPAILAGLPSLTNNSYISSQFAGNRLEALPHILGKNGYSTAFFHGGRNGTMGFDEFSRVAGIQHYYGMNEYEGPSAFDKSWGIFDDEFLQYTAKQMQQLKEPFFSAIFTLSSHHPYFVPAKYDKMIPSDEEPQLRSIRYTDIALRNFLQTAKQQPWFKNTLFVLVADHTAKVIDQTYNNPVGNFRIPIAFYHPGEHNLNGRRNDIVQQTDIMPSILHFLGIEQPFLAYGTSVFSENRDAFAINYLNGIFNYFEDDCILSFDGETTLGLYNFKKDIELKNNIQSSATDTLVKLENKLKATVQDFQIRLEENKLFYLGN